MNQPAVSVIIVSRGRPEALALCLEALARQDHPGFEVIVVADPAGVTAIGDRSVKRVVFDVANISAARNAGIAVASGEILAFIDDDAVAEPRWLARLTQVFVNPEVAAAGGFVKGRNGISYQWQARVADRLGRHQPLSVDEVGASLHPGVPGRAIRTEGTNMALRRDVLVQLGGFDPAYAFYLDETDLNMRIAGAGMTTAVVPRAVVHHGFAAGPHRRADRVPRSLFEIGASSAVFWRKHAGGSRDEAREDLLVEQESRLERLCAAGKIDRHEVDRLMATLTAGMEAGETRELAAIETVLPPLEPFLPYRLKPGRGGFLSGRYWRARAHRQAANTLAQGGGTVVLLLMSPTMRRHRIRFRPEGYWEQTGGLFGASGRSDAWCRPWSFNGRSARERTAGPWQDRAD